MVRAVVLTHGHEDHVGALPYLMREVRDPARDRDAPHARARQVEARRARAAALGRAARARARRRSASSSARSGSSSCAWRTRSPTRPRSCSRRLAAAASTRATTSSTTRRSTASAPTSAGSRRSATAASTSCSATRRTPSGAGVTQSERVVGEAFRQIFPQPRRAGSSSPRSPRTSTACSRPRTSASTAGARSRSSAARCARTRTSRATSATWTCRTTRSCRPNELAELPRDQQLILCTGSQGEPMSAMTRIAYNDHPAVQVERGDTVIISAKPIPGNELRVHDAINRLAKIGRRGAARGQRARARLRPRQAPRSCARSSASLRPKAVMPMHGEFRMLAAHAQLAREGGVPEDRIVIAENGSVVELRDGVPRIVGEVEAGNDVRRRARSGGRPRRRAARPAAARPRTASSSSSRRSRRRTAAA